MAINGLTTDREPAFTGIGVDIDDSGVRHECSSLLGCLDAGVSGGGNGSGRRQVGRAGGRRRALRRQAAGEP